MNRRSFVVTSAASALSAAMKPSRAVLELHGANPKSSQIAVAKKANLKLGTQHGDSDDILKVLAAFGVNHICALAPGLDKDRGGDWSLQALSRKREHIESYGIKVDALRLIHPTYVSNS